MKQKRTGLAGQAGKPDFIDDDFVMVNGKTMHDKDPRIH